MEQKYTEEERDNFAIAFCAWYCHSEDAKIYKSQKLSTGQILKLYKDRPYLKTDKPEQN